MSERKKHNSKQMKNTVVERESDGDSVSHRQSIKAPPHCVIILITRLMTSMFSSERMLCEDVEMRRQEVAAWRVMA